MESLADLLGKRLPEEPREIKVVKKFIKDTFNAQAVISLKNDKLVITVSSAALANTLRLRTLQIQEECNTTKTLVFRIA